MIIPRRDRAKGPTVALLPVGCNGSLPLSCPEEVVDRASVGVQLYTAEPKPDAFKIGMETLVTDDPASMNSSATVGQRPLVVMYTLTVSPMYKVEPVDTPDRTMEPQPERRFSEVLK
jgi:hypothetical protein